MPQFPNWNFLIFIARELFDGGITSVEELKKNQDSLTPYQKIGLKHFEDFELRIPRDEIGEIEIKAKKAIQSLDENYQVQTKSL